MSEYKIPVVTLTNGSKENTIRLIKNNKISKYIKQCFSIDEIKIWKPNKETYLYVCKKMKIKPSNTLMIATHGWDIDGAKNAGLKTGYISRFENILSDIYSKPNFFEKDCLSIIKKIIINPSSILLNIQHLRIVLMVHIHTLKFQPLLPVIHFFHPQN